ncbi:TetR/AcrR family transcriptional regulator [Rhizobium sp. TH2]|uniref:TetR/AcrR family transcriptional regulator n=1 Tax=Rhizobium sp. TH2 TaxID=2775403 RepID=UPI0021577A5A|nr:TetR/AcrR family transcriptional regulator [Rhizobium sp. TH2]UVC11516.1 TetR/AcrR family transcriptional regulator [Rhizobium sp. TH2]
MTSASTDPLSRRDWIVAAFAALQQGGVSDVKVDRIADRLHVTRGSFYWHFKSRADLLSAMQAFWENEMTGDLIKQASTLPDASARLRSVAADALEWRSFGLDVHRVEEALRAWAAHDAAAARCMLEVDRVRIGYIEGELIELGQPREKALRRARLLYFSLIGLFIARGYNAELADDAAYAELVELVIAN